MVKRQTSVGPHGRQMTLLTICLILALFLGGDASPTTVPIAIPQGRSAGLVPIAELDPYNPSPYHYDVTQPAASPLERDPAGHVWLVADGGRYPHPVAAAQFAIAALERYSATGEGAWLRSAEAAAREILSTQTSDGLFPYLFSWMSPRGVPMPVPWYSAMAQGSMLSVCSRLWLATGDESWLLEADRIFASLTRLSGRSTPWVSEIDEEGYLWLEEWPAAAPARAFNGHMFAAFGIYDYWRVRNHSSVAAALFDEAATTIDAYRLHLESPPGQPARYGVLANFPSPEYNPIVAAQLRTMTHITGNTDFANEADLITRNFRPG